MTGSLLIKKTIIGFYLVSALAAQTEVMILSQKVGTEIDMHENRFYRIFPKEKGFINAQIIRIDKENFSVVINKKIRGKERLVKRYISLDDYEKLQLHVDAQSELTEKAKIEMYEGMDFLRAEKIVNEIPKPQYVILKHSGQKKLKGALFFVDENMLHIQTPTTIAGGSYHKNRSIWEYSLKDIGIDWISNDKFKAILKNENYLLMNKMPAKLKNSYKTNFLWNNYYLKLPQE